MIDEDIVQASDEARRKLMRMATIASVVVASFLILVKLLAWSVSGSSSLLASLVDSVMDGTTALISVAVIRFSLAPADEAHRFGHGKADALGALLQGAFIAGSGLFLLLHSIERILRPVPIEEEMIGIVAMLFSMLATIALILVQRHVLARTESSIINANFVNYLGDLFANALVLFALFLSKNGLSQWDAILAVILSLYLLYSAKKILAVSVRSLLDTELSDDTRCAIKQLVLGHEEVEAVARLRSRDTGPYYVIQLDVELNEELTVKDGHRICQETEAILRKQYPHSDIMIRSISKSP